MIAVDTLVCADNNQTYVGTCASTCDGFDEDEICEGRKIIPQYQSI